MDNIQSKGGEITILQRHSGWMLRGHVTKLRHGTWASRRPLDNYRVENRAGITLYIVKS
ncbi:hypothetical protein [Desulfosporosinus burensis]